MFRDRLGGVRRISIERVSLAWRLSALVAAPLLVIALVAGARLESLWSERHDAQELTASIEQAALIEGAITALQNERDATAHVVGLPSHLSPPPSLWSDLSRTRERTDAAVHTADLSTVIPALPLPSLGAPGDAGGTPLTLTLEAVRDRVDQQQVLPADAVHVYTALISEYVRDLNSALASEGDNAPAQALLAYTAAVSSTEAFSRARAWGTTLLNAPDATPREWILLATLAQTEEFFLDRARRADPARGAAADRLLDAPPSRQADHLRWEVINGGVAGTRVTPPEWQAGTQPRVDALRESTNLYGQQFSDHASGAVSGTEREAMTIAGLALMLIAVVAFAAWCVTRSIAQPLERLAVGARAASRGDLATVELPDSHDAIGEIGRAYGLLDQYLHHVADSAEEIAEGNLGRRIRPRSPRDRLGTALQSMTNQLSSMVVHSRQRSEALEETVDALQETASRDPLTGLLNRGRFVELLGDAIEIAGTSDSRFGVLFMDLDGFKPVNDQFGHGAGDELLRQVGSRLLGALRVDDVVARLGGDEFTILITSGFDAIAAEALSRQIIDLIAAPYFVQGEVVEVRASVGLAYYPEHGDSVEALVDAADRAMYAAKAAGGNEARVCDRADEAA